MQDETSETMTAESTKLSTNPLRASFTSHYYYYAAWKVHEKIEQLLRGNLMKNLLSYPRSTKSSKFIRFLENQNEHGLKKGLKRPALQHVCICLQNEFRDARFLFLTQTFFVKKKKTSFRIFLMFQKSLGVVVTIFCVFVFNDLRAAMLDDGGIDRWWLQNVLF